MTYQGGIDPHKLRTTVHRTLEWDEFVADAERKPEDWKGGSHRTSGADKWHEWTT